MTNLFKIVPFLRKAGIFAVVFVAVSLDVAMAEWRYIESADEMSGDGRAYIQSPNSFPTKKLQFPYSDLMAQMSIGCDKNTEWAYIWLNNPPIIIGGETFDGYDVFRTRVKWDDDIVSETLIQEWGEKFLQFSDDKDAIRRIAKDSKMKLELDWYGIGKIYFNFSLADSSVALEKMRAFCAKL